MHRKIKFIVLLLIISNGSLFALKLDSILPEKYKNPNGGHVASNDNSQNNFITEYYPDGSRRKFFIINNDLKYFFHYAPDGRLIFKFIYINKKEYAVIYFNEFEWLTKILFKKQDGSKTLTIFRRMKNAIVLQYNKYGKLKNQYSY